MIALVNGTVIDRGRPQHGLVSLKLIAYASGDADPVTCSVRARLIRTLVEHLVHRNHSRLAARSATWSPPGRSGRDEAALSGRAAPFRWLAESGRRTRPAWVNPAPTRVPLTRGLHEVADRGVDARRGDTASRPAGRHGALLVDTLFDLALTREMLAAMVLVTERAPITDALITHSNGDHTHGTQLRPLSAHHRRQGHLREVRLRPGTGDQPDPNCRPGTVATRKSLQTFSVTLTSAASSCATPT